MGSCTQCCGQNGNEIKTDMENKDATGGHSELMKRAKENLHLVIKL